MSNTAPIAVVKIGGSLLDLPEIGQTLTAWLSRHSETRLLLMAGGGPAADVVRNWHQTFSLSEEDSHWLAVDSLSLTASLLHCLIPASWIVDDREQAERCWETRALPILNVGKWLRAAETQGSALPHTWDVTSDSLAAWVTRDWPAELWLLKSADFPEGMSWPAASDRGLVDRYFPRIASEIPQIRWCNLRNSEARLLAKPGFVSR